MFAKQLNRKLLREPEVIWSYNYMVAFSVPILLAAINVFRVVYNFGYMNGQSIVVESYNLLDSGHLTFSLEMIRHHISITIALTICAAGLLSRKARGFFLSMLALGCAGVMYIDWYYSSKRFMRAMDISNYSEIEASNFQHIGVLRGATWWDIVILIAVVTLFVWHLKVLISRKAMLQ